MKQLNNWKKVIRNFEIFFLRTRYGYFIFTNIYIYCNVLCTISIWKFQKKFYIDTACVMCVANRCIYYAASTYMKEEEEVPTLDLTKYYRYVTGKLILCYIACTWDCHSLHEASPVFRSIIIQIRSAIYFYRQYDFY